MEILDAFNSDVFRLESLVHSINHMDYAPSRLAELGLFNIEPIATTSVMIEEEYGTLKLVPTAPRGGVPEPVSRDRRKARSFAVPHIPTMTQVQADEIQNVRAFGAGNMAAAEMMAVEQVRDKKLRKALTQLEVTVEYHRLGAIKGLILDADGVTTVYDLFTEFEVTQNTYGLNLDDTTTKITQRVRQAQRLSQTALGNARVAGWLAICGDEFFDELVGHPKLEQFYLNQQAAMELANGIPPYSVFRFAGVSWENYRGSVGGVDFITSTKAYLVPLGVPNLFLHYLAPADYMETVNTLGLPFYSKAELMKMNKGIDIECQTNPLLLCSKPAAIVELDETAS